MKTLFIFLLTTATCWAQRDSNELHRHTIGFRFSGYVFNTTDNHPAGASTTFEFRIEPYYLYSLNHFLSIGAMGEYHTGGSSLSNVTVPSNSYGFGLVSRLNYPFFKDENKWKNRFDVFSELSFSATNFYLNTDNTFVVNSNISLDYWLLRIRFLGVSLRVFKQLHLDLSVMTYKFDPGRWGILGNVGLYYKI